MGFDNECILNIQSLAGEYFCPVCRLLVYPNEALQSQCTHLYCKPCLTYIASTTRACPYDGYLVTEADSKPLVESNKTLAETIGKITVHCLYHRSGCTWQGPLSECTTHCSGCAFGNSPVVCNRCGIQIVHRQVQEHAQNCPSVQPQSQQAEGGKETAATGTTATADQTQLAPQAGIATSQVQASQTTASSTPAQDPNQQANPNFQSQAVSQAVVVTSEPWYQQQQQQYQQYYQQYSGYDPQYQQYYPYQQQAVPQYQQQSLQVNTSQIVGQHPAYLQTQPQPQSHVQPQPHVQSQVQPQPQSQPQAQPQSHSSVQGPVAAQPQNQIQVNQQKQTQLTLPLQSQIPSQTYPTAQGLHQPQVQPFPQAPPHLQVQTIQPHLQHGQMPQYQQHHSQMQQPQPQLHPAPLAQPHSQAQSQAQLQPLPQPQPQLQPQPQSYPQSSQPLNPNLMPQTQHPATYAVTGHQSYPQSQPHQQMQLVTPQHPVHMHPQGGVNLQQHPAEIQSSYPQQPPQMRPPQSHAAVPNQQQLGLLPLPGPMLQQVHPQSVQPAPQVQQRPVVLSPVMSQQYVQQQPLSTQPLGLVQPQLHQQGPFLQQQQSLQSQLHPLGRPHPFQQPTSAYPQPQQTVAGSQAVQPHPSYNLVGKPLTPNHGVQQQQYPQSAADMQVVKPIQLGENQLSSYQNNVFKTNNQPVVTSQPMSELPGDHGTAKNVAEQEADSSSRGIGKKEANELAVASSLGINAGDFNASKSNADLKSVDQKCTGDVGDNSNAFDISTKDTPESRQTFGTELEPLRDPMSKNSVKVEAFEVQKQDVENAEHKVEDGPLLKTPPLQEAKHGEEQNGKLQKDEILCQDQGTHKGPAGNVFKGILPSGQVQPSHSIPIVDQKRHQPPQMPYGSNNNQQRPAASAMLQAPPPGLPPNQFRPQGPGFVALPRPTLVPPGNFAPGPFGRGPSNIGPQGPYNQGLPSVSGAPRISQGEPLVGPVFGTTPLSALDSHGAPSYGPEGHLVHQRSANMVDYHADNRQVDPRASGLDSTSMFPLDHAHHAGGRGRFEEDHKQFPRPSHLESEPVPKFGSYLSSRPLDRGPHGFGMNMGPRAHEKEPHGLTFDPIIGSGPSRFLPPGHPDDAGERQVVLPEDALGRPDFLGTVPSYGRHHMGGFGSRSPGREYPGMSPHGFGHPGDEMDGRERRFNDRFSGLPGHPRRGGFESSDHMAEHFRSRGMIGPDIRPPHFRRGEHLGHHNMPGHLRMGEPAGFGDFSSHERMGEFGAPGNFHHPRLGEPGFRSSFSLREFPNDGGIYTGDMDSFGNMRKKKSVSMGWCRICKVDCETVEGLDLHSQTREHQKMAMDMVVTIKQNAKKQKLTSSDHSVRNDSSRSRNSKFEGRVAAMFMEMVFGTEVQWQFFSIRPLFSAKQTKWLKVQCEGFDSSFLDVRNLRELIVDRGVPGFYVEAKNGAMDDTL